MVATAPEWFVHRWNDLKTIWAAVRHGYVTAHNAVPSSWPEPARHGIPIALGISIAAVACLVLYRIVFRWIWAWNRDRWDEYRRTGDTDRKTAFTVFWAAVSMLSAVLIASAWTKSRLNVLSWFLMIFPVVYCLYHRKSG